MLASMNVIDGGFGADGNQAFLDEWANWRGLKRIHITFDVDWAPDWMLQHLLRMLDRYPEVGCTFFATHETELLKRISQEGRHEVGWHPNLGPGSSQGANTPEVLRALAKWYPDAVGCRFHVLGYSYRDLMKLAPAKLRYDVSYLLYNASHLQPAYHRDLDLTLIPYFWEDGICENAGCEVSLNSVRLDTPGIKVLNFHPMNIYINGPSAKNRLEFMSHAGALLECTEDFARQYRQEGATGAQCVLESLLEKVVHERLIARPVRDLEQAFTSYRLEERV